MSKLLFKNKPYVTFENPATQALAEHDPQGFLKKYASGAIFDEIQRAPFLLRYLQEHLDNSSRRGQFILTGSNNLLLQEQISQSLAGRVGYLTLLPLSYGELSESGIINHSLDEHILRGGYPEIWKENLDPKIWHNSYLHTYVQRDVRLVKNIQNLAVFSRFIYSCAHHAGQILNRDELSKKIGVDTKTIQSWLGLLENSYIIFLQQPWYNNLNKRIIKSPKLYFHDTGLLCHLLGIKSRSALQKSPQSGSIFENWIVSEIFKNKTNAGENGITYYFRDSAGNEVDVIIEKQEETFAIEIKAGTKFKTDMFRSLHYWKKYRPNDQRLLITAAETSPDDTESGTTTLSWKEVRDI